MKDKKPLKKNKFFCFNTNINPLVFVFIIVLILLIGFYMTDYFILKKDTFTNSGKEGPISLNIFLTFIVLLRLMRKPFNFLVKKIKKLINYNDAGKNKKIISFCINFTAIILILIILSLSAILLLIFFIEIIS